jgi:hypothetical protein
MLSNLIQSVALIIWDEVLMTNKTTFEALDITLLHLKNFLLVEK